MFFEMTYKSEIMVLNLVCSLYRSPIRLPLSTGVLAPVSAATQSSDILGRSPGL